MRQQRDPPHQIGALLPEHSGGAGLIDADDVVDELQKLRRTVVVVGAGHRRVARGFTTGEEEAE